jgi:hypothetical protein
MSYLRKTIKKPTKKIKGGAAKTIKSLSATGEANNNANNANVTLMFKPDGEETRIGSITLSQIKILFNSTITGICQGQYIWECPSVAAKPLFVMKTLINIKIKLKRMLMDSKNFTLPVSIDELSGTKVMLDREKFHSITEVIDSAIIRTNSLLGKSHLFLLAVTSQMEELSASFVPNTDNGDVVLTCNPGPLAISGELFSQPRGVERLDGNEQFSKQMREISPYGGEYSMREESAEAFNTSRIKTEILERNPQIPQKVNVVYDPSDPKKKKKINPPPYKLFIGEQIQRGGKVAHIYMIVNYTQEGNLSVTKSVIVSEEAPNTNNSLGVVGAMLTKREGASIVVAPKRPPGSFDPEFNLKGEAFRHYDSLPSHQELITLLPFLSQSLNDMDCMNLKESFKQTNFYVTFNDSLTTSMTSFFVGTAGITMPASAENTFLSSNPEVGTFFDLLVLIKREPTYSRMRVTRYLTKAFQSCGINVLTMPDFEDRVDSFGSTDHIYALIESMRTLSTIPRGVSTFLSSENTVMCAWKKQRGPPNVRGGALREGKRAATAAFDNGVFMSKETLDAFKSARINQGRKQLKAGQTNYIAGSSDVTPKTRAQIAEIHKWGPEECLDGRPCVNEYKRVLDVNVGAFQAMMSEPTPIFKSDVRSLEMDVLSSVFRGSKGNPIPKVNNLHGKIYLYPQEIGHIPYDLKSHVFTLISSVYKDQTDTFAMIKVISDHLSINNALTPRPDFLKQAIWGSLKGIELFKKKYTDLSIDIDLDEIFKESIVTMNYERLEQLKQILHDILNGLARLFNSDADTRSGYNTELCDCIVSGINSNIIANPPIVFGAFVPKVFKKPPTNSSISTEPSLLAKPPP